MLVREDTRRARLSVFTSREKDQNFSGVIRATYTTYCVSNIAVSGVKLRHTYGKASLVCESRTTVPWLNLIPEDDLNFSFIFTISFDQWLHDCVDGYRKLSADRRDNSTQRRKVLVGGYRHLKGQT
jgi:hypothetical protein